MSIADRTAKDLHRNYPKDIAPNFFRRLLLVAIVLTLPTIASDGYSRGDVLEPSGLDICGGTAANVTAAGR